MTFTPVIPFSGYAGWSFLQRTLDVQKAAFNADAGMQREEAYFRGHIGNIQSAEQLVADHRLLKVALGAFGLEADIGNKFFIQKVLSDGTLDAGALSNKLSNKQYKAMAKAFGFGDFNTPRTRLSDFPDEILASFRENRFEVAVGESDADMRVALYAQHALPDIAAGTISEDGKWFSIMGSAPLRSLFETAFGLSSSFGALDIDQQLETLKSKAKTAFGEDSVAQFFSITAQEKLTRLYLVRTQIRPGMNPGLLGLNTALQLMRS
ncbi:DUF1217 domain-containing protein [Gemmobacter lutimaris]|uniref:DUF1217 domain-containing protein n=1 Tax=Gemmobacter lutimaris TaxID=2306023 RepID=A0A398BU53_9RHOB|nr:DUF1217 domain-containing protein [Gemmobacter lutimaris]RID90736.1 DUF1217 domain-containing protein [Gemmobacter lutimaris]